MRITNTGNHSQPVSTPTSDKNDQNKSVFGKKNKSTWGS